jgi:hypothetical protein
MRPFLVGKLYCMSYSLMLHATFSSIEMDSNKERARKGNRVTELLCKLKVG